MRFLLPIAALVARDLIRFWREKARVLGFVGSPLLFWFLVGSGFGDLGFFFPGTLVLTVMFSAVFSTISLIEDRREGFLLSMLVSPAPRPAMVLGKVLGSTLLAWIQGLLFLLFLPLTPLRASLEGVVQASSAILLVSFTFTAFGFLIAWHMDSSQGFHAIMNLVLFPLWLVSGALFAPDQAHGWLQVLMRLNPVTYMVAAVRGALGLSAGEAGVAGSAALVGGLGILLFAFGVFAAGRKSTRSFA